MFALSAQVVLHIAVLASANNSYEMAYKEAASHHKPLLVLVSAQWCPACRTMKDNSIPSLKKMGGLNEVVFATVNADNEPKLANQLMKGKSIPQLILYAPKDKGWHRAQLTGAYDPAEIQVFLRREIKASKKASARED